MKVGEKFHDLFWRNRKEKRGTRTPSGGTVESARENLSRRGPYYFPRVRWERKGLRRGGDTRGREAQ